MTKRLAILPARSGSTRIKDKNIAPMLGKPMISYPLNTARESGLFDEIHVSTDSQRYVELCEEMGFSVPFLRHDDISANDIGLMDVMRWAVREYENRGKVFDQICLLYPTAVLLAPEDLVSGTRIFEDNQGQLPVMSVATFPAPIERAMKIDPSGALVWVSPESRDMHSQDCLTAYFDTASFFIISRDALMSGDQYVLTEFLPCIIDRWRAVDINVPEDLIMAERLLMAAP